MFILVGVNLVFDVFVDIVCEFKENVEVDVCIYGWEFVVMCDFCVV